MKFTVRFREPIHSNHRSLSIYLSILRVRLATAAICNAVLYALDQSKGKQRKRSTLNESNSTTSHASRCQVPNHSQPPPTFPLSKSPFRYESREGSIAISKQSIESQRHELHSSTLLYIPPYHKIPASSNSTYGKKKKKKEENTSRKRSQSE